MRTYLLGAVALTFALAAAPANAWNARGHMIIAAAAWNQMTPTARSKAADLLKANPRYGQWTAGVPQAQKGKVAFLRAAVWADDIKTVYEDDGDRPPGRPTDGQNIGYSDTLQHRYWHYKSVRFRLPPPAGFQEDFDEPNAVTQVKTFAAALGASELSDDIRSYDLVWLLHLVGDIHQPLHAGSRMSTAFPPPDGDRGGNKVKICISDQSCAGDGQALHSYWDGAFGRSKSISSVTNYADDLTPGPSAQASDLDPETWNAESLVLAKTVAHADPIQATSNGPQRLTVSYRNTAAMRAIERASLAATRLANLLNAALD